MKENKYTVLSKADSDGTCPAVVQYNDKFLIIGRQMDQEEVKDLLANADVGVASYETVIEIDQKYILEAAQKQLATANA